VTDISKEAFHDALESVGRPVATAAQVARELGCTQAEAADALEELAERGDVERAGVESDPVVWYPRDWLELTDRERVVPFPGRREIIVDQPAQFTRAQLSRFAHLEDTTRTGSYRYVVREEDVWAAPFESLEALLDAMRRVLPREVPGLEDWVEEQWTRATRFRLRTHDDGYVVLEAKSESLLGNVAEQKLADDVLRAKISDTEAWVAEEKVAELKRTLYEAGYPVRDDRDLETGDPLDVTLNLELRDYQADWVERFVDANSGVLVGPPGAGRRSPRWARWRPSAARRLCWSRVANSPRSGATNCSRTPRSPRPGGRVPRRQQGGPARHHRHVPDRGDGPPSPRLRRPGVGAHRLRRGPPHPERGVPALGGPPEQTPPGAVGDTSTGGRQGDGHLHAHRAAHRHRLGRAVRRGLRRGTGGRDTLRAVAGRRRALRVRQRERPHARRRLAAENPAKDEEARHLLGQHPDKQALVFVDYLEQGRRLAEALDAPFVSGETRHVERQSLFDQFRTGALDTLVVSRIGDEGIDLPDAELAIVASGLGGSRRQGANAPAARCVRAASRCCSCWRPAAPKRRTTRATGCATSRRRACASPSPGAAVTDDRLRELHDHLAATGELPVERSASHYLGEAEAVVADALKPGTDDEVVQKRVEQARELLSNVEGTGDERADEHVEAARACCAELLDE